MEKILIFGGTFDPPHQGHRHLLKHGLMQAEFDRVLLMPSYIPPHKEHRPTLSFGVRKGILLDWFGDLGPVEVSDLEQRREGRSYTVDTVRALEKEFPDAELYFLIGSDMLLSFERWYCAEELLQKLILVVGSREKGDLAALKECRERLLRQYSCKGILLCEMDAVVCASSSLRGAGDGLGERILAHLSETLDDYRLRHTVLVAEYARELALRHGLEPEQAYLAGLLHDCTKHFSAEQQLEYAEKHGLSFTEEDLACPQVLHQYTAVPYAREVFGVEDAAILAAIGCHTTGKEDFSPLEMLIYFADSCEPSRTYPGVEELRRAGEKDLPRATLMLMDQMLKFYGEKKQWIHSRTVKARNYLKKELEKNGKSD